MNPASISGIKKAAEACSKVRSSLLDWISPGMTTSEIDSMSVDLIRQTGAVSAVFGRNGFPGHICICINTEVAHYYGRDDLIIKEDDLVKIDVSLRKESWVADCGATFYAGSDGRLQRLIELCKRPSDPA